MCITLLTHNSIQCYKTFASSGLPSVFVFICCMKKHCQLLCISPKIWHANLFYLKVTGRTCTKFWAFNNKQNKYTKNDLCHLKISWHWPIGCIRAHKNDLCLLNSPGKRIRKNRKSRHFPLSINVHQGSKKHSQHWKYFWFKLEREFHFPMDICFNYNDFSYGFDFFKLLLSSIDIIDMSESWR